MGTQLKLVKLHVLVEPINIPETNEWIRMLMEAAYGCVSLFCLRPNYRVLITLTSDQALQKCFDLGQPRRRKG